MNSETRTIISNVIRFFDTQKKSGNWILPLERATELAASATGKSVSFIKRLRAELRKNDTMCAGFPKKKTKHNKVFFCKKCPALLTDNSEFQEHMKSHEIIPEYKCPVCLKSYNRHLYFVKHKEKHTEFKEQNIKHECDVLLIDKSSSKTLEIVCVKTESVHGETAVQSEENDKKTIDDNDKSPEFITPDSNSTEIEVFADVCNVADTSENEIEQVDVVNESVNHQFACTRLECGKICKSLYSLKAHELRHVGKRPFLCVICGKDFVTKNSLTCHEKIHLDKKGYICKLCNMEFSVRSNLRTHEKKYHEGFKFYCSKCTRCFLNKCSLERHEKTHIGIKEFKCDSCKAAFYTTKELLKHRKYHEGLRQYKCEQCFKTFFERHHLVIHLRIHSGEKPYVCQISDCRKSFTESQKLKKHQNTKHTHHSAVK